MADPKNPDGGQPPIPPPVVSDPPAAAPSPPSPSAPTVAPTPLLNVRAMNPEEIRQAEAAEQARILAEVEERNATDEHVGGRFLVNGILVNAEGVPIKSEK